MNKKNLADSGYSLSELRKHKRRRWLRRALRLSVFVVLLLGLAAFTTDYVSRLPRERHARNHTFLDRFKLGVEHLYRAVALTMGAERSDPRSTKLPIAEIYIEGHRLDELNSKLPFSGAHYQSASFKIGNKVFDVKARYRGDSMNHWAFPSKSWRVRISKGRHYQGMQYLNLAVPRSPTQLANWLGYSIAERLGGPIVPHAELVHFRLNRKFDGVRLLLEQPNHDLLHRRNLPIGKIYIGDIGFEHIYGGVERKRLYQDPTAWEIEVPYDEPLPTEMVALIDLIKNQHNPYQFYDEMHDLMDVEAILRYMALLELVGSVHVDETHNGKFYFHPDRGVFLPIAWDPVAYFWGNAKGVDLGSNSLFRVLLSNPGYRAQKDAILWEAIKGDTSSEVIQGLIKSIVAEARADIEAFALKVAANDKGLRHLSNEEWEGALEALLETVPARHSKIRDLLSGGELDYRLVPGESDDQFKRYLLGVQVKSRVGVTLRGLSLQLKGQPEGVVVRLRRRGLEDLGRPLKREELSPSFESIAGNGTLLLGDRLFSKRRFDRRRQVEVVPATYVYEIEVPQGHELLSEVAVDAAQALTGHAVVAQLNEALKVPTEHKVNSVWWRPERFAGRSERVLAGDVSVDQDLVLDRYTDLRIEAGTVLTLAPETSIVLRGGVLRVNGTADAPVVLRGSFRDRPWGVLAVNQGEAYIRHAVLEGGSEDRVDFVRYTAPLSIHGGVAEVEHVRFEDGFLSVREGDLAIKDSVIRSILPEPIQVFNAFVKRERVETELIESVHDSSLLSTRGFGTPGRREREFKFTISSAGLEELDGMQLAETLNRGLAETLVAGIGWRSPKVVNQPLRIDPQPEEFGYRDIYYDTEQDLNYLHRVSYRLRNRFEDQGAYRNHVKRQYQARYWPYRLEFQAKFGREELGDGYSTVDEARFEFRRQSQPFSDTRLPPPPPWDLDEYGSYFSAGRFKGITTLPAQAVYRFLKSKGETADEFAFQPRLVLFTERYRQHLNILTPWGSGPNPEQAFIISLDRSDTYNGPEYLDYLRARKFGAKKIDPPPILGTLVEIEVEFERNVSDKLDQEIEVARRAQDVETLERLKAARSAFLADQRHIMEVVQETFAEQGISVFPASKSKYAQAFEMAFPQRAARTQG